MDIKLNISYEEGIDNMLYPKNIKIKLSKYIDYTTLST